MKTSIKIMVACLIMLMALPGEAQIGNLRSVGRKVLDGKAEEAKTNAEEKVAGEVTNEESVAGDSKKGISLDDPSFNIIFSSSPIDPQNPDPSKKEFVSGDYIYALAQLPKAVKQYYSNVGANPKLDVEVFLYSVKISPYEWIKEPVEEQMVFVNMKVSGSIIDNKYLLIDLVPDPGQTDAYGTEELVYRKFGEKYDGPVNFAETLAQSLEPGDNAVKMLVKCYYEDVARAMFKISGDDFSVYNDLATQLNDMAKSAGAKNTFLPKAEKSDPALEKQMIATVKGSNAWANKRLDATEILRVNIYDEDWYIRRHEISGAILHRYIRAAMAVKTQAGDCAYYIVTFQEDYVGGKFQPMKYDGAGDKVMMDCANVNQ